MRLAMILLVMMSGCVTATVPCPRDRLETVQIQGPDYGTLLTMLLQGATTIGPLLGATPGTANDGTMTVRTLSYGQQNYTCGRAAAAVPTPTPAVAPPMPRVQPQIAPQESVPLPPTRIL